MHCKISAPKSNNSGIPWCLSSWHGGGHCSSNQPLYPTWRLQVQPCHMILQMTKEYPLTPPHWSLPVGILQVPLYSMKQWLIALMFANALFVNNINNLNTLFCAQRRSTTNASIIVSLIWILAMHQCYHRYIPQHNFIHSPQPTPPLIDLTSLTINFNPSKPTPWSIIYGQMFTSVGTKDPCYIPQD